MQARSLNDEEERLHAEADGGDDSGSVGPGSSPAKHVLRDGGREMADLMSAAEGDAAHKAAGPKAQQRAVQTVDRLLRAYQARLPSAAPRQLLLPQVPRLLLPQVSPVLLCAQLFAAPTPPLKRRL